MDREISLQTGWNNCTKISSILPSDYRVPSMTSKHMSYRDGLLESLSNYDEKAIFLSVI